MNNFEAKIESKTSFQQTKTLIHQSIEIGLKIRC